VNAAAALVIAGVAAAAGCASERMTLHCVGSKDGEPECASWRAQDAANGRRAQRQQDQRLREEREREREQELGEQRAECARHGLHQEDDGARRGCGIPVPGRPSYCVRCPNPQERADIRRRLLEAQRRMRERNQAEQRRVDEERERKAGLARLRQQADADDRQLGKCSESRLTELGRVRDAIIAAGRSDHTVYRLESQMSAWATRPSQGHWQLPVSGGAAYDVAAISAGRIQQYVDGGWGIIEWIHRDQLYDGVPFTIHYVRLDASPATALRIDLEGEGCVLVVVLLREVGVP
jgi:hypothetical protein